MQGLDSICRCEVFALRLRRVICGIVVNIVIGRAELGPDLLDQLFYCRNFGIIFSESLPASLTAFSSSSESFTTSSPRSTI